MKTLRLLSAGLALAGAASLAPVPALASRVADQTVGTVTAQSLGDRVVVDGQTYEVLHSDVNALSLLRLKVGDRVGLVLDGPPGAKTTRALIVTPQ